MPAAFPSELAAWIAVWTVVGLVTILSDILTRRVVTRVLTRLVRVTRTSWDDTMVRRGVLDRASHLVPGLVVYLAAGSLLSVTGEGPLPVVQRLALAYMLLVCLFTFYAFCSAINDIYIGSALSRIRPIKGYLQILQVAAGVVVVVLAMAIVMDKSPWRFFASFGALTAVILIVFRDSLLGLVAGIQLTADHMVQIGDWVELPQFNADGDVIDISLNTVKVQNWDKTITTVPTYALISSSFKNWRGMQESGGRRICRCLNVDLTSIRFCSDEMLDRLERIQLIRDYVQSKRREVAAHNREHEVDESEPVNGRRLTNIGTFRAYIVAYLRNNPNIAQQMTFLVRHQEPGPHGLPIQIYVFTNTTVWADYEGIQADVFDHILAAAPEFGLRVFQQPSGYDVQTLVGALTRENPVQGARPT
jgi:miniconductance mechanosensitive channel